MARKKKEKKKQEQNVSNLDLQEIPTEELKIDQSPILEEIPLEKINDQINDTLESSYQEKPTDKPEEPDTLKEIPPKPFKSSLITTHKPLPKPLPRSDDTISDAFKELKKSVLEEEAEEYKLKLAPLSKDIKEKSESALLKQQKLEKDMTEVLSFLSKKISVKKLEVHKPVKKTEPKKKIPPTSMNEILKELVNLDSNIEASAILKTDGEILASAISTRISDSLFATIGMNLSMIGTDIIEGLSAGTLKSISVQGSNGVLSLAPIDIRNPNLKDMILILFSDPKVKSGIISFAVHIVKKQVKEYLGFDE
ncbi:MAG: roadblock/LC7 domain-containing protein [Promethearchaeota archaeon]